MSQNIRETKFYQYTNVRKVQKNSNTSSNNTQRQKKSWSLPSLTLLVVVFCIFVLNPIPCHSADPAPVDGKNLSDTAITLGQKCYLKPYQEFNRHIREGKSTTIEILMTFGFVDESDPTNPKTTPFKDLLSQLCIEVVTKEGNKYIDTQKFDCRENEKGATEYFCNCSQSLNSIDPYIPEKIEVHGNVTQYIKVEGLNRRIMAENGECVSGVYSVTHNMAGHCGPLILNPDFNRNKSSEIMKCRKGAVCIKPPIAAWDFNNSKTNEPYGSCRFPTDDSNPDRGDNQPNLRPTTNLLFFLELLLIILALCNN